jgi:predicted DNA-binding transcriptional regulator AlpA
LPTELVQSARQSEVSGEYTTGARAIKLSDTLPRLMLTAAEAAAACGFSLRTWWRYDSAGKIPKAVNFGRSKRWPAGTLRAWVEAGCPDREQWEAIKVA